MVSLAIGLGIYSYLILTLGLLGWLYRWPVFLVSLPFVIYLFFQLRKIFLKGLLKDLLRSFKDKIILFSVVVIFFQIFINFLGAISPELSFDALWYHLPSVKMYVANHRIIYIPGWLMWPANVTRLTEMFYTVALLFSNEIGAKLIHFTFGILSAKALFNLLKRYLSLRLSWLGVATFYTMLIVGWQSTTAYIDLSRTFFEIITLDLFLQWNSSRKDSLLWESAVLMGLTISTKIMAFSSLIAYMVILFFLLRRKGLGKIIAYCLITILTVSPWLVLSYVHTGNFLFPLFGNFSNPLSPGIVFTGLPWFLRDLPKFILYPWNATINPDDIISPVYLIFLPLVFLVIRKQITDHKIIGLYLILGLFFTPRASNRYLLPYLSGLTVLIFSLFDQKIFLLKKWQNIFLGIVIVGILFNTGSRLLATKKFFPYLAGKELKKEFLSKNLNFSFGDFYDVDGWFAKNIQKEDLVLIYDIHNLYYVDFPYIHESWAKKGTYFTHILVGDNKNLPEKFGKHLLLYQNKQTGVKVYTFGQTYQ